MRPLFDLFPEQLFLRYDAAYFAVAPAVMGKRAHGCRSLGSGGEHLAEARQAYEKLLDGSLVHILEISFERGIDLVLAARLKLGRGYGEPSADRGGEARPVGVGSVKRLYRRPVRFVQGRRW